MRIAFLGNFNVSYSSESHHAKSLEALGHTVVRLQEPTADLSVLLPDPRREPVQLFVWVHTHGWEVPGIERTLEDLKRRGIPCITYHLDLYMGLPRWDRYLKHPYMQELDHWFTVDPIMAEYITENTRATGHYLPAAVFGDECYIADESPDDRMLGLPLGANDVVFVGSRRYHPEWPYRPKLIDWLGTTYGDRFTHVGGDGATGTIRGAALNTLYASSKVVVGDTLCLDFDYRGYWSDRVYETLGRGGFLIHPYIKGMGAHFNGGQHLAWYVYDNFDQLKEQIDYYLEHDDEREAIRRQGHLHVKENHTYQHRWETILRTIT